MNRDAVKTLTERLREPPTYSDKELSALGRRVMEELISENPTGGALKFARLLERLHNAETLNQEMRALLVECGEHVASSVKASDIVLEWFTSEFSDSDYDASAHLARAQSELSADKRRAAALLAKLKQAGIV